MSSAAARLGYQCERDRVAGGRAGSDVAVAGTVRTDNGRGDVRVESDLGA